MDDSTKSSPTIDGDTARRPDAPGKLERGWLVSVFWAALIIGIGIALSATINPLLDRSVHWDWMAVLAPVSFALFAWALRHRWV